MGAARLRFSVCFSDYITRAVASAAGLLQPLERARFLDVATDEPIVSGVAGRYAAALVRSRGRAEQSLPRSSRISPNFSNFTTKAPDLQRLVRSPVIAADDQARALSAVLDKAGAGALAQNFFSLVARNRRLFAAPDMARAFARWRPRRAAK